MTQTHSASFTSQGFLARDAVARGTAHTGAPKFRLFDKQMARRYYSFLCARRHAFREPAAARRQLSDGSELLTAGINH